MKEMNNITKDELDKTVDLLNEAFWKERVRPREQKYFSNDEVETPNGWGNVIGEMGGDMDGCVLVRHKKGAEFKPELAVKTFGKGTTGQAAAYRIEQVQPANGLPGMS